MATLLRRAEGTAAASPRELSSTLPAELEAWRESRARSQPDRSDDSTPSVPAQPEPTNDNTLPSPLSPSEPFDAAPMERRRLSARDIGAARADDAGDADEHRSPFGATGAPVESQAGSPVDFLLSDMGQWPGGAEERDKPVAVPADARAKPDEQTDRKPDSAADSEPSFVAAAQRRAFWASRPVRAVLWTGALLLIVALVVQIALARRSWLAAHVPALAPALQAACQAVGCRVEPYRDLDAIVIDGSAFNRSGPASFRFSVTLRNQSDVPVATPSLELTLTDAMEQPVVRRVVGVDELNASPTLAARGEFAGASSLVLTGVDNVGAITGYRLVAFYP